MEGLLGAETLTYVVRVLLCCFAFEVQKKGCRAGTQTSEEDVAGTGVSELGFSL